MSALTLPAPPPAPPADPFAHLPPVAPLRWTREEYYRLAEDGYFAGKRVMLIDGEVLTMSPQNEPHSRAISLSSRALEAAFNGAAYARVQMPLDLGQTSDPEPDVAMAPGDARTHPARPHSALLVVEVSDSSLAYDTGDKASLYAAGGIADYWVVDLVHNRLIVFRDPARDPATRFGHAYTTIRYVDRAQSIAPLAAPTSPVAVADLML
ncbi:MAG TPA: Uma2 family endonuclease [Urbifossiella sp.]|nr:Uma2 family endonuclease [Urbifossiella sp.]